MNARNEYGCCINHNSDTVDNRTLCVMILYVPDKVLYSRGYAY